MPGNIPEGLHWPKLTDRLPLGGRGLTVSPLCVGIVRQPGTICAAFDAGINFFFVTADMHWPLYEATRRGLRDLIARGGGIRDQIVVAAVCYPTQPEFCWVPFEELLEELPVLERLDVLLAGGAYASDFSARLPVYQRHRRKSYVGARAIGATFHDRQAARQALAEGLVDIALIRYNAGHAGARDDVFPQLALRQNTLLFGFKSTSGYVAPRVMARLGLNADTDWRPRITDHYRFALSRPGLDGLLVAPATPQEVTALALALERGPLSPEEEAYLMNAALVAQGRDSVVADPET
jgi:hypothetical protein